MILFFFDYMCFKYVKKKVLVEIVVEWFLFFFFMLYFRVCILYLYWFSEVVRIEWRKKFILLLNIRLSYICKLIIIELCVE